MDNVLLVVPAVDDNVIDPGKGCMAVPDGPVHVFLERWPCISQSKGHPLVLEQAEGGGTGRCWLQGALPLSDWQSKTTVA